MSLYDPHVNPQLLDESHIMGKGRLIKARFPDQPVPNVSWFWIQLGNCWMCKHYVNYPVADIKCLDKKINRDDFLHDYMYKNTCPQFDAGISKQNITGNPHRQRILDVMRAAGIAPGTPSQQVKIIVNEPWSIDLALRAHREQSAFLNMAEHADYITNGGSNDPSRGEYVDLSDDLERADSTQPTAPETSLEEIDP